MLLNYRNKYILRRKIEVRQHAFFSRGNVSLHGICFNSECSVLHDVLYYNSIFSTIQILYKNKENDKK